VEAGCRLALKRTDIGFVSQEQCEGIQRRAGSGVAEITSKSHFVREGDLLLFFQGLQ
jgi:hypothetical protein